jgi:hypothetical protein
MNWTLTLLAILAVLSPCSAKEDIELRGVVWHQDSVVVGLTDKDGITYGWFKIGDKFRDWTISAYSADEETVVLIRVGQTRRMRLKSAGLLDAKLGVVKTEMWLNVTIAGDPALSRNVRTSTRGSIMLPLVGEIKVVGESVEAVRQRIVAAYRKVRPETDWEGKVTIQLSLMKMVTLFSCAHERAAYVQLLSVKNLQLLIN